MNCISLYILVWTLWTLFTCPKQYPRLIIYIHIHIHMRIIQFPNYPNIYICVDHSVFIPQFFHVSRPILYFDIGNNNGLVFVVQLYTYIETQGNMIITLFRYYNLTCQLAFTIFVFYFCHSSTFIPLPLSLFQIYDQDSLQEYCISISLNKTSYLKTKIISFIILLHIYKLN